MLLYGDDKFKESTRAKEVMSRWQVEDIHVDQREAYGAVWKEMNITPVDVRDESQKRGLK